jgi:MEMO1 family protein
VTPMQHEPRVRAAAVAGQFYPRSPERLRGDVEAFLTKAAKAETGASKAVIAPHAGYVYSGTVAAAAFATLRGQASGIRRVVLIGPAHYIPFLGLAVPTASVFETPLGRMSVARDAAASLEELDFVVQADAPHLPEHALEVELPFLQVLLPAFELVPIVVGEAKPEEVAEALARVWGGPETLIVVSSDLSHFHEYETARRLDAATAAAIERGDWASLGPNDACGYLAVAGLLIEARRRSLAARRLMLCSSGDTAGSRDRVVGYGAWVFDSAHDASDRERATV